MLDAIALISWGVAREMVTLWEDGLVCASKMTWRSHWEMVDLEISSVLDGLILKNKFLCFCFWRRRAVLAKYSRRARTGQSFRSGRSGPAMDWRLLMVKLRRSWEAKDDWFLARKWRFGETHTVCQSRECDVAEKLRAWTSLALAAVARLKRKQVFQVKCLNEMSNGFVRRRHKMI